ncbi:Alkaline phosphatase synthesis transcriptional regulatory protein SphR [Candidatus Promineifilum breve]|uniref:Alkaline phosphatase synthesis transcriptional regulatory protein SphR n=1 Tax=Candidatus Promineifilum breve TaxID=1806508 RepID=A0A170PFE7_9CHLR|nr:response regulator transcription factor [Candidatus Promineifilum breve]CUS03157.2 Alkaline phosphatase synthesis transcriptional regulatory protein SphR [Candidatus Promineifilum breve]
MSKTILVVDDMESLRTMVKAYLTQEGFRVVTAANGREALFVARQERPDLIILDLMMPELSGYDFINAYAREGDAPIIVLTAKVEESDKVLGLELGADDYLTKPFSMRELTARIRAVLRRLDKNTGAAPAAVLRAGDLALDRSSRTVMVGATAADLTPSEFDLLATLLSSPGRVFSRLELLDKLQGDAYEGYERTIDVHIRNLRTKIEPDPRNPRYVVTVYGIGYRLAADPTPVV